ncbi:MAG: hypothetical protein RL196_1145 [Actinomycetota bacterium]|jgi:pyruvate,water dikinase
MSNIGGKAQGLIRLRDEFGLPVPAFIVVPFAESIGDFEKHRANFASVITDYFASGDEQDLAAAVEKIANNLIINDECLDLVNKQVAAKKWRKVSFRTSAVVEDGPDASFAGQYESFVDVDYTLEALHAHAKACFLSMLSLRVIRYARERHASHFEIGGSFIVQEMFYGTASGVLFTENGSGAIEIHAVDSWRNTVVEGSDALETIVSRENPERESLSPSIRTLCQRALEAEARIGRPLDIEWSAKDDKVMFLQMRPITVARLDFELDWDSTNISENYPGITLPLTYSVIRELYAGVYQSFFRLLGTPEKLLKADEAVFRNMLGYLHGHVYYRITNWYVLLKFLPGRANQEFFEAMLSPVVTRGEKPKKRGRLDPRSFAAIIRFIWVLLTSEGRSRRFRQKFASKLTFFKSYHVNFVNAAELLDASKKIRAELLADWATPILNDVKLMVFHGLLKKYFFYGEDQTSYLAFLQGLSDRASLKPLEQLSGVGATIAKAMTSESVNTIDALRTTPSWSLVAKAADEYVTAFGSRTPGELKLESVRLTDDIADVLQMALKAHESTFAEYAAAHSPGNAKSAAAMAWPTHVPRLQRPMLRWVANNTRRAIDWRERFRFNRAQTFDLSRSLYDAVAKVLVNEGLLAHARDIYWLTEHEVDEIVNAHAWSLDAKPIVAQRKALFAEYESKNLSLAMHGAGTIAGAHLQAVSPITDADALAGKGVAPGVLTAEVIICKEFDPNVDVRGKILVVHHIDPGWTLLFTQAAGIVAERGNALSHAAIIAREIGIPAVVAAPNATSRLVNGETITINGILGTITREKN